MKCYVVFYSPIYGEEDVVGVFLSAKLAMGYITRQEYPEDYFSVQYELIGGEE